MCISLVTLEGWRRTTLLSPGLSPDACVASIQGTALTHRVEAVARAPQSLRWQGLQLGPARGTPAPEQASYPTGPTLLSRPPPSQHGSVCFVVLHCRAYSMFWERVE